MPAAAPNDPPADVANRRHAPTDPHSHVRSRIARLRRLAPRNVFREPNSRMGVKAIANNMVSKTLTQS
jgi:hypothetical protein